MSKVITVRSCAECPFFQQTTLGVIAALTLRQGGQPPLMGECGCPSKSGVLHFPVGAPDTGDVAEAREAKFRRLKIRDGNALPSACPLYQNNVTVTIKT